MPLMMAQALSHARHMIMLLYSALTLAAAGMHPIPMDSFAWFYSFWQLNPFSDLNNLISFCTQVKGIKWFTFTINSRSQQYQGSADGFLIK